MDPGSLERIDAFPVRRVAFRGEADVGQEELTAVDGVCVCVDRPPRGGLAPDGAGHERREDCVFAKVPFLGDVVEVAAQLC